FCGACGVISKAEPAHFRRSELPREIKRTQRLAGRCQSQELQHATRCRRCLIYVLAELRQKIQLYIRAPIARHKLEADERHKPCLNSNKVFQNPATAIRRPGLYSSQGFTSATQPLYNDGNDLLERSGFRSSFSQR